MIKKKIHLKSFLLLIYAIAGLLISLFTAVMTYLIIGEPIGAKMTSKIALTIFVTLPVIGIISYFIGNYLAQKFSLISQRLDAIHKQEFLQNTYYDNIIDIHNIHDDITYLSKELEMTINKLQQHNNNLSTIVKSLSHDIKTPLTIIDGYESV
jgi:two-component system sensor histidine kinase SaeS